MFGSGNSMLSDEALLTRPVASIPPPSAGGEDIAAFSEAILRGGRVVYEPRSLCRQEHRPDEEALRNQLFNFGASAILRSSASAWVDDRDQASIPARLRR